MPIKIKEKFINPAMATDEEVAEAVSEAVTASSPADRARVNHTGTQTSSTISDFASTVRDTVLTGITFLTTSAITATDSFLIALGKIQAQINLLVFGSYFQKVEDAGETSTTSTSVYAVKITLVTPNLPLGDYLVLANYRYRSSANRTATIRIVEGATVLKFDEPAATGLGNTSSAMMGALLNVSGVKTLKLDFKVGNSLNSSAATAIVSQACLTFWRIK